MEIDYKQARREIMSYIAKQDKTSLKQACEDAGVSYTSIYNQTRGIQLVNVYKIREFVEKINEKFTAVEVEGKLVITRR